MNPKAISKSRSRLRLAAEKLREAEVAENYQEFADVWYFFLVAVKNIYTSLEQGAKSSAQSRQWWGAKKGERKNDPLLQYLFQARNDEEHGVGDVTRLEPGSLVIGKGAPGFSLHVSVNLSTDASGRPTIHRLKTRDNLPILIEQTPARAILLPVRGRGNDIYDPPAQHLGKPLPDNLPMTIGKLAIQYLTRLVDEAAARAV